MNRDIIQVVSPKMLKLIDAGLCPFCEKSVDDTKFSNDLSRKEFKISGMCQGCQDALFGPDESDDSYDDAFYDEISQWDNWTDLGEKE